VTQAIRLPELIEFRADKRVRKKLFEGAQLWGELLCYEVGQATPSHYHPREDELFVILERHAAVLAGDQEIDAPAGSLWSCPQPFGMTSATWATVAWSWCSLSPHAPLANPQSLEE
jgi:hypothetical protein